LLVCPAFWFKRATLTGSLAAEPVQEGLCFHVVTRAGVERYRTDGRVDPAQQRKACSRPRIALEPAPARLISAITLPPFIVRQRPLDRMGRGFGGRAATRLG
jgi:hypothetical protein